MSQNMTSNSIWEKNFKWGGIYSCNVLGISSFNPTAYRQTTDYISEKVVNYVRATRSVAEQTNA